MTKPSSNRKKATSAVSNNLKASASSAQDIFDPENPASATITVSAAEVEELSEAEERDRLHLERRVERAFFEAGKALAELRDRRLYRSTHKTFEQYCKDRFGYTRIAASYKIAAATVMDNLLTNGLQKEEIATDELQTPKMLTNGLQILPNNERQVRPLVSLEPKVQREAWQKAVEEAGGKVPSGRIVKNVVQRIIERTRVPNTYQLGEVCQILAKDNPELRGKGGCWGIVNHVGEFSCTVTMWDGEYTVRIDHLKPLNYLESECQQMHQISDRISRLRDSGKLEASAEAVLKCLGELKRPYLTQFEEELLSFIEQKCQVED
ncbi:MAG: hypothetical protein RM049_35135 [Nostoc sp. DedQUE04]|uniref:hypothetical protein n=1 Tax=Nostoc sp. DedQUE04 TaxID=3075390 RepID=UPI002AD33264|nr:hypothetical protein [Nostoc sp. DedQUE04]MDZ8140470.1 hypothetical protein [Nostoc sp. DedQUE04]